MLAETPTEVLEAMHHCGGPGAEADAEALLGDAERWASRPRWLRSNQAEDASCTAYATMT